MLHPTVTVTLTINYYRLLKFLWNLVCNIFDNVIEVITASKVFFSIVLYYLIYMCNNLTAISTTIH